METRKKQRTDPTVRSYADLFDRLPDDLVISILCKLSSTALSPSDFFTVLVTCKRLNRLGLHPLVLNRTGAKVLAVRARNWSESAHRFLRRCVCVGNVEACYILGMIRFYCLQNRPGGLSLMAKAAIKSHAPALYSLAVIHLNGSGATKNHKDLHAGVAFFARAASLGHVDALRELGHCLQDGYGIYRSVHVGYRLIMQANMRELESSLHTSNGLKFDRVSILSQLCGCHVAEREPHVANKFLMEWFGSRGVGSGLRICSNAGCGRPETRANEYRRCAACGKVNYCSRGCQAQDWKMRHKVECAPSVHVEL